MNNENNFGIKVNLSFDYGINAETYEEAVKYLKYMFLEQHNIELQDSDIDKENALHNYIERQENLWNDLETIKKELLSVDETLVEWLQCELKEVIRLYKENK